MHRNKLLKYSIAFGIVKKIAFLVFLEGGFYQINFLSPVFIV